MWCDNDVEFVYLIKKWAQKLQFPWLKQEICEAVGGDEGTGKTSVFLILGKIIGTHFAHIQNQEDLVGNFTSARANKIWSFADECCFDSKNTAQTDILKNTITGATERVRDMYSDPYYTESYQNISMASNNVDKYLPAGENARRFFALLADPGPLLNHSAFSDFNQNKKIWCKWVLKSMYDDNCHGIKVFANFLMNLPVDRFDCRQELPTTNNLLSQKINNLQPVAKWVYEKLVEEEIFPTVDDTNRRTQWRAGFTSTLTLLYAEFKKSEHTKAHEAPKSIVDFKKSLFRYLDCSEDKQMKLINVRPYNACVRYFLLKIEAANFNNVHLAKLEDLTQNKCKIDRMKGMTESDFGMSEDHEDYGWMPKAIRDLMASSSGGSNFKDMKIYNSYMWEQKLKEDYEGREADATCINFADDAEMKRIEDARCAKLIALSEKKRKLAREEYKKKEEEARKERNEGGPRVQTCTCGVVMTDENSTASREGITGLCDSCHETLMSA